MILCVGLIMLEGLKYFEIFILYFYKCGRKLNLVNKYLSMKFLIKNVKFVDIGLEFRFLGRLIWLFNKNVIKF